MTSRLWRTYPQNDDVFVIVIVFVLVGNFPINDVYDQCPWTADHRAASFLFLVLQEPWIEELNTKKQSKIWLCSRSVIYKRNISHNLISLTYMYDVGHQTLHRFQSRFVRFYFVMSMYCLWCAECYCYSHCWWDNWLWWPLGWYDYS
jgi:hypothetical protein